MLTCCCWRDGSGSSGGIIITKQKQEIMYPTSGISSVSLHHHQQLELDWTLCPIPNMFSETFTIKHLFFPFECSSVIVSVSSCYVWMYVCYSDRKTCAYVCVCLSWCKMRMWICTPAGTPGRHYYFFFEAGWGRWVNKCVPSPWMNYESKVSHTYLSLQYPIPLAAGKSSIMNMSA